MDYYLLILTDLFQKNQPIDTIINLNKLIKHRGPDGEGYYLHDIDRNIHKSYLNNSYIF